MESNFPDLTPALTQYSAEDRQSIREQLNSVLQSGKVNPRQIAGISHVMESLAKIDQPTLGAEIKPAPLTAGDYATAAARVLIPGGENTVKGVYEGLKGIAATPGAIYKAATTPPSAENPYLVGPLVTNPMEAEAAKSREDFAKGNKVSGTVHAVASDIPLIGPMIGSLYEKGKTNPVAAAAEGITYAVAPELMKVGVYKTLDKVVDSIYGEPTGKNLAPILKSAGSSKLTVEDIKSGSSELNKELAANPLPKPSTEEPGKVIEAFAERARNAGNSIWNGRVIPAIDRHPGATFDTSPIAQSVKDSISEYTKNFEPEKAARAMDYADTWAGKEYMDIAQGNRILTGLNERLAPYFKADSNTKAQMIEANPAIAGELAAQRGLRQSILGRLEQYGEQDVRSARLEYGAISNIANTFEKRIPAAQRTIPHVRSWILEAGIPGVYFGTLSGGAEGGLAAGATTAAAAATDYLIRRSRMPDFLLSRGVKQMQKLGVNPPTPLNPPEIRGFLPRGAIQLPAPMEPAEATLNQSDNTFSRIVSSQPPPVLKAAPDWLVEKLREVKPELSREQIILILRGSREQGAGVTPSEYSESFGETKKGKGR